MINLLPIAAIIVSYLLGNISPAILIGKVKRVDIRKEGSGNAGTTNVLRVIGKKAAAATLAIDMAKGAAAVLIGGYIGGQSLELACGMAVLAGHIWPFMFGFRGGKGIATAFGIILTIEPLLGLIEGIVALIFFLISRRVSVGSIAAALLLPAASFYFNPDYLPWTAGMALIVLFKHRLNIKRLLKGEEPKVRFSKQEGNNE